MSDDEIHNLCKERRLGVDPRNDNDEETEALRLKRRDLARLENFNQCEKDACPCDSSALVSLRFQNGYVATSELKILLLYLQDYLVHDWGVWHMRPIEAVGLHHEGSWHMARQENGKAKEVENILQSLD